MTAKGFTLIEVLVVVLLVGILSTVAVTQYIDFTKDAKINVTLTRMNDLRMAIDGDPRQVAAGTYVNQGFIQTVGSVPASLADLSAKGAYPAYNPFTRSGWNGPYVSTVDATWDKDAWGTALVYDGVARTITSCGPDMVCANADDIVVSF